MTGPAFDARGAWLDKAWDCQPRSFTAVSDGATISCRIWDDEQSDVAKPLLVLVPGFRATAQWWDHIAPHFARRFRVVSLALSGMGDSSWRSTYSRAGHARELIDVIDALDAGPATIIAHSYGTFISLIAAGLAPDRFERLILVDGYPAEPTPIRERGQHHYASRDDILARYRLVPPGGWPDERILDRIAQSSIRESDEGWTWKFDALAAASLNHEAIPPRMGHVTMPVDLIYGELTEIVPLDRIPRIRDWLPTLEMMVPIPLAHHHIMIEQPEALVAACWAALSRSA